MDEYHKVGTTFRTSFDYPSQTVANTYVTGLTQASFTVTLAKNGTIGQSTAGITITELASPTGSYDLVVSGASGFAASTGVYKLVVRRTSIIGDEWAYDIRVTSDGTGAGTWGDAVFTATASDGRVMSGGSPLADATIRIVDSTGALYVQTTSGATGLWGPIYFNASGTYTVYVQKSGYTTATGTITVAGSSAVGPGADLSITAAATSTGILASDLWARFKRVLRDRSGSQADDLARQGVDDALTQIAQEREWPWYHTVTNLQLQALYDTGTIAVTNASPTVTLTGGTWPTWAGSADLYIGGRLYQVLTRDSATVLTLADDFGEDSDSALPYVLGQCSYAMPTDLTNMDRMLFEPSWPYGARPVSMATLSTTRSVWQFGQQRPSMFAISRDKFVVWPWPNERRTVTILYYRRPALLSSANDTADWDPMQLPVLHRAIEYQASLVGECVCGSPEQCLARYRDAVVAAEANDRSVVERPQFDPLDYQTDGNARAWGSVET